MDKPKYNTADYPCQACEYFDALNCRLHPDLARATDDWSCAEHSVYYWRVMEHNAFIIGESVKGGE